MNYIYTKKKIILLKLKHITQFSKEYIQGLNMFPDNFTKIGLNNKNQEYLIKDTKRAFLMGNAMVTGIVKKIGTELIK